MCRDIVCVCDVFGSIDFAAIRCAKACLSHGTLTQEGDTVRPDPSIKPTAPLQPPSSFAESFVRVLNSVGIGLARTLRVRALPRWCTFAANPGVSARTALSSPCVDGKLLLDCVWVFLSLLHFSACHSLIRLPCPPYPSAYWQEADECCVGFRFCSFKFMRDGLLFRLSVTWCCLCN